MAKRLFALVVALAVVGAPLALEACQIACETSSAPALAVHHTQSHGDHRDTPTSHASCHEAPVASHHVSPGTSLCDHDREATVLSATTGRNSDTLLSMAAALPIDDVFVVASVTFVQARPRWLPDLLGIRLASPLRL